MSEASFLDKTGNRIRDKRGGTRRGAGRPKTGKRVGVRHRRREAFRPNQPLHITMRVDSSAETGVGSLRRRFMYAALRAASVVASKFDDARIVHLSIQRTHVHMIVEAQSREALGQMIKSFAGSAAKTINRAIGQRTGEKRTGGVFVDRYHVEVLRSPAQTRHALSYVLNNWRKHGDHRDDAMQGWRVDPFSTGFKLDGWREGLHLDRERFWSDFEPLSVWPARTWLLTTGWRMYGLIGVREKPGEWAFARKQAKRDERIWRDLALERERMNMD